MKNKLVIPTILFVVVFVFLFFALLQGKNQTKTNKTGAIENQPAGQIILFYGEGCPHCALVDEYIKENKVKDKVSFVQKEVYYNESNLRELKAKAEVCGLSADSVGVPFLWDGERCLIGDQNVINFFKQKMAEVSVSQN